MSQPNFMNECYEKFVTPERMKEVKNMTAEDCGIIIVNKDSEL